MKEFEFDIGAHVIVEVAGRVVHQGRSEGHNGEVTQKYIIQPHNSRIPAIHAAPDIVFPDDDANALAEVIPFPPRLPGSITRFVQEVA